MVTMRDGVRLATDLYFPPRLPAGAIAMRTPYGRAKLAATLETFARQGYVAISQDCRGTGDSEPDSWDFYVYEQEDGIDFVEWVTRQEWFDGFLGACGGSYAGGTQWSMAMHPRMSTIAPEVSSLLVTPSDGPRHYMFQQAYVRSVGKGEGKVAIPFDQLERQLLGETLAGGYFNEPLRIPFREALLERYPNLSELSHEEGQRWLWERFRTLEPAGRADLIQRALGQGSVDALSLGKLHTVFGHGVPIGLCIRPRPGKVELIRSLRAVPLIITGWYDWGLREALETWRLLGIEGTEPLRSRARLFITPAAHNMPGYHEGAENHAELRHNHRTENNVELLLSWYRTVREGTYDEWPAVTYYLMGANEWRTADDYPVSEARETVLYLRAGGTLGSSAAREVSDPDRYTYDPRDPTPTVGGSIVSYAYPPGSVDVSRVQQRPDVLVYTTLPLERDLDIVGPLRLVLYASSSAVDTDFAARLSDVFPDGRAIQLQSAVLRARYRDRDGESQLLEPGRIYGFAIDLWATANRFKAGHRLRLDISSADFPRFDRNANRGGEPGPPIPAVQSIYRDSRHPSHLVVSILEGQLP